MSPRCFLLWPPRDGAGVGLAREPSWAESRGLRNVGAEDVAALAREATGAFMRATEPEREQMRQGALAHAALTPDAPGYGREPWCLQQLVIPLAGPLLREEEGFLPHLRAYFVGSDGRSMQAPRTAVEAARAELRTAEAVLMLPGSADRFKLLPSVLLYAHGAWILAVLVDEAPPQVWPPRHGSASAAVVDFLTAWSPACAQLGIAPHLVAASHGGEAATVEAGSGRVRAYASTDGRYVLAGLWSLMPQLSARVSSLLHVGVHRWHPLHEYRAAMASEVNGARELAPPKIGQSFLPEQDAATAEAVAASFLGVPADELALEAGSAAGGRIERRPSWRGSVLALPAPAAAGEGEKHAARRGAAALDPDRLLSLAAVLAAWNAGSLPAATADAQVSTLLEGCGAPDDINVGASLEAGSLVRGRAALVSCPQRALSLRVNALHLIAVGPISAHGDVSWPGHAAATTDEAVRSAAWKAEEATHATLRSVAECAAAFESPSAALSLCTEPDAVPSRLMACGLGTRHLAALVIALQRPWARRVAATELAARCLVEDARARRHGQALTRAQVAHYVELALEHGGGGCVGGGEGDAAPASDWPLHSWWWCEHCPALIGDLYGVTLRQHFVGAKPADLATFPPCSPACLVCTCGVSPRAVLARACWLAGAPSAALELVCGQASSPAAARALVEAESVEHTFGFEGASGGVGAAACARAGDFARARGPGLALLLRMGAEHERRNQSSPPGWGMSACVIRLARECGAGSAAGAAAAAFLGEWAPHHPSRIHLLAMAARDAMGHCTGKEGARASFSPLATALALATDLFGERGAEVVLPATLAPAGVAGELAGAVESVCAAVAPLAARCTAPGAAAQPPAEDLSDIFEDPLAEAIDSEEWRGGDGGGDEEDAEDPEAATRPPSVSPAAAAWLLARLQETQVPLAAAAGAAASGGLLPPPTLAAALAAGRHELLRNFHRVSLSTLLEGAAAPVVAVLRSPWSDPDSGWIHTAGELLLVCARRDCAEKLAGAGAAAEMWLEPAGEGCGGDRQVSYPWLDGDWLVHRFCPVRAGGYALRWPAAARVAELRVVSGQPAPTRTATLASNAADLREGGTLRLVLAFQDAWGNRCVPPPAGTAPGAPERRRAPGSPAAAAAAPAPAPVESSATVAASIALRDEDAVVCGDGWVCATRQGFSRLDEVWRQSATLVAPDQRRVAGASDGTSIGVREDGAVEVTFRVAAPGTFRVLVGIEVRGVGARWTFRNGLATSVRARPSEASTVTCCDTPIPVGGGSQVLCRRCHDSIAAGVTRSCVRCRKAIMVGGQPARACPPCSMRLGVAGPARRCLVCSTSVAFGSQPAMVCTQCSIRHGTRCSAQRRK